MSKSNPRSPGRAARHKSKRVIEKKHTFGEVVAAMNDKVVYTFEDGPIAGKSMTGAQWKQLLAVNERIMKEKPEGVPIEEYVKQVMTNETKDDGAAVPDSAPVGV